MKIARAIWNASRELSAAYRNGQKRPITLPQVFVLQALVNHGRPMIEGRLVEASGTDRSTLSAILGILSAKGFVVLGEWKADPRATGVGITDLGLAVLRTATAEVARAERALEQAMPARHAQRLPRWAARDRCQMRDFAIALGIVAAVVCAWSPFLIYAASHIGK